MGWWPTPCTPACLCRVCLRRWIREGMRLCDGGINNVPTDVLYRAGMDVEDRGGRAAEFPPEPAG